MLNLPSTELAALLDRVLAKYSWTQERLADEMDTGPHTVSRWRSTGRIHKAHHAELLRLEKDEEPTSVSTIHEPLKIPFSFKIPRSSLRVSLDKNGDINVSGTILALLDKKED